MKAGPPVTFMLSFGAFIVIGGLSLLKLPCPLSHGTGIIEAAQGLTVDSVVSKSISVAKTVKFSACGAPIQWIKYKYLVNMSLTNNSSEPSMGSVSVTFTPLLSVGQHLTAGEGEADAAEIVTGDAPPTTVSMVVDVPAKTTKTVQSTLSFEDQMYDVPSGYTGSLYDVTVGTGKDIPDPTCTPSGKVPFVTWLQVKLLGMKIK